MTNAEIKAELRRSACEDFDPWEEIDDSVWQFVRYGVFIRNDEAMIDLDDDDLRTFFLLIAEAL